MIQRALKGCNIRILYYYNIRIFFHAFNYKICNLGYVPLGDRLLGIVHKITEETASANVVQSLMENFMKVEKYVQIFFIE